MDIFTGSGPTLRQIHDIHYPAVSPPFVKEDNPLYGPIGTGLVPEESVKGSPFGSLLTLDLVDVPQVDSFQIFAQPEKPAKAAIHLEWRPGADAYTFSSNRIGISGSYLLSQAKIDFSFTSPTSATDDTVYTFKSNPEGQRVLFAQVGHERNGLFLGSDTPR